MEKIKMTFAQFMTYTNENRDEKPLYIFDSGFGERLPGPSSPSTSTPDLTHGFRPPC